jgi:hypothetical protein
VPVSRQGYDSAGMPAAGGGVAHFVTEVAAGYVCSVSAH